jgi:UDP-N-acetylmuramyl pentapeptide phosphotransferase/UDP-N-acetylglucosamine-1-phosphate transferase
VVALATAVKLVVSEPILLALKLLITSGLSAVGWKDSSVEVTHKINLIRQLKVLVDLVLVLLVLVEALQLDKNQSGLVVNCLRAFKVVVG